MSRPRLIASDLDGTLLDPEGRVTDRTRQVWQSLWAEGIETVLVTARPPRWVDQFASMTGEHGVVICANGAFVYDVANGRLRETHTFDPALLDSLLGDLGRTDGISFAVEAADGFHRQAEYHSGSVPGVSETDPEAIGDLTGTREVGKLLAQSSVLPSDEFIASVVAVIGERALLSESCEGGLAEIGPAHVTKAWALKAWADSLGIAADEVWAFGDMPNDIPMLTWAGTGWAVANAHPDVHAIADRGCGPNSADGVAEALADLLG